MQILLIIIGAVIIGSLSENFGGVVGGGIAGFLLAEILTRGLTRIVSFIDVALLLLPIGYFSPVPPKRQEKMA